MSALKSLLIGLLTFVAFAGCLDSGSDDPTDTIVDGSTIPEPIPDVTDTPSTPASPATWWTSAFTVTGEAVQSHIWQIPANAGANPTIDVAPLVDDVDVVDEFGFLVFAFDVAEMESNLIAAHFGSDFNVIDRGIPDLAVDGVHDIDLDPFRLELAGASAGEVIGILVAGEGSTPSFGFAWTLAEGDLAENRSAFFESIEGETGGAVQPVGFANTFQAAFYADLNEGILGAPPGFTGLEIWNDAVTVTETGPLDGRPIASIRAAGLHSDFTSDEGWGYTTGVQEGTLGAVVWSAAGNVHGHALASDSVVANVAVVSTADLVPQVLGYPVFLLTGEGPGGSNMDVGLIDVQVDLYEAIVYTHFEVDATLESLFGLSGASIAFAAPDLLPIV